MEQLKERLLVAETMMKKLYQRSKELEEYISGNINSINSPKNKRELDQSSFGTNAAAKTGT